MKFSLSEVITLNTTESLQIVGEGADKIKNNIKEQSQQFSWKLKFPKEVLVDAIPTDGIAILNKNLKRVRTEFIINTTENAIFISPQTPYKKSQEYFFWAKYNRKEICVCFMITEENQLKTYDQKRSIAKLTSRFNREAKRTQAAQTSQAQDQDADDVTD